MHHAHAKSPILTSVSVGTKAAVPPPSALHTYQSPQKKKLKRKTPPRRLSSNSSKSCGPSRSPPPRSKAPGKSCRLNNRTSSWRRRRVLCQPRSRGRAHRWHRSHHNPRLARLKRWPMCGFSRRAQHNCYRHRTNSIHRYHLDLGSLCCTRHGPLPTIGRMAESTAHPVAACTRQPVRKTAP
jgi:hypothetical protein